MQTIVNSTAMHGRTRKNVARPACMLAVIILIAFAAQIVNARALLYNVAREQAKKAFMHHTGGLLQQESDHFTVRYQEGDAAYARLILETAENIYEPVGCGLGYHPAGKTLLVIYPDREELNGSFGWSSRESAMGVYWAGVIRLLSPGEWIKEGDPDRLAAIFLRYGPIAHEFSHLLLDCRTSGNYPRWFTEGIAQYQEYKLTGEIWAKPAGSPGYYSLDELAGDFDRLPDQNTAYYQSFLLVDYLAEQWGDDGLEEIIRGLAAGQRIDRAVEAVTGYTSPEFERHWLAWAVDK